MEGVVYLFLVLLCKRHFIVSALLPSAVRSTATCGVLPVWAVSCLTVPSLVSSAACPPGAALFTEAASASLLAPLLPRGGDSVSPASAAQARPLVWQGKTIFKYAVKLHPTKINGKLVGDEGASGKYILKAVRYSATSYYIKYTVFILNIRSGGEAPTLSGGKSCAATVLGQSGVPWTNITSDTVITRI
ncbi:unnamed protein product [Closterium sp. NIES-65]|nr:unnamed protein product [Closterium sp. NIES-65]